MITLKQRIEMVVDIILNMYKDNRPLVCLCLYFGKALVSQWDGWQWVERNGMEVDAAWALDYKNAERGTIVSRERIIGWIESGYLSKSAIGDDRSADFIRAYPKCTVFKLCFLDWN